MKRCDYYTTNQLIEMGYIDKDIVDMLKLLTNLGIKTTSSCAGHKEYENDPERIDNVMYPYIDFEIGGLSIMFNLISNYEHSGCILIQHRQYEHIDNMIRIFPYCKNLSEGQKMFKDFELYLNKLNVEKV